jgi:hypothetical protein
VSEVRIESKGEPDAEVGGFDGDVGEVGAITGGFVEPDPGALSAWGHEESGEMLAADGEVEGWVGFVGLEAKELGEFGEAVIVEEVGEDEEGGRVGVLGIGGHEGEGLLGGCHWRGSSWSSISSRVTRKCRMRSASLLDVALGFSFWGIEEVAECQEVQGEEGGFAGNEVLHGESPCSGVGRCGTSIARGGNKRDWR